MTNDTNGCLEPRIPDEEIEPDELDMRIRSLEAERARPVVKSPSSAQKDALRARADALLRHIRHEYGPLHGESYPQEIEPNNPQGPGGIVDLPDTASGEDEEA